MPLKGFLFSLVCVLAWFLIMPLLLIAGGAGLLWYALFLDVDAWRQDKDARSASLA